MSVDLPIAILLFSGALFLTLFALVYLFVRRFPLSSVWWKRSDYVYFTAAILGSILGLVEQSSNALRSDIVQLRIERNDLASVIATRLMTVQEACRRAAEIGTRQRERREGILRPYDDDDSLGKWLPEPDGTLCKNVNEAITTSETFLYGGRPVDVKELKFPYFTVDSSPIRQCAPYDLPHSDQYDFDSYELRLAEPSERLYAMCEEMETKSKSLAYMKWLDPIEGLWPVLLGFALGVRLTRVHADIKNELHKDRGGHLSSYWLRITQRIAVRYVQIQNRLRLPRRSYVPTKTPTLEAAREKEGVEEE